MTATHTTVIKPGSSGESDRIYEMTATNYKLKCGCTLQDEMKSHDSLPEDVRVATEQSPFGTCARETADFVDTFGAEAFLRALRHGEKQLRRNQDQDTRV